MSKYLRWIAFYIIIENGLLYFVRAQTQYDKAAYLGYLATGSFVLSFLAALFIYKKFFIGWVIGLVTSIGSIAGYVLTRTVALPGLAIEPWNYPYGILSSAVSALFILLFLISHPWKSSNTDVVAGLQQRSFLKRLLPLTGLILVGVVSLGAYQWDRYAFEAGYHVHVGSLGAVCRTPLTSCWVSMAANKRK